MTRIVVIAALVIATSGCGAVQLVQYGVRRTTREIQGIRYDAFFAEPPAPSAFTPYTRVQVEPLVNEMEEQIPEDLVASLNQELSRQVGRGNPIRVAPAGTQSRTGAASTSQAGLSLTPESSRTEAAPVASARAAEVPPRTLILRGAIVDFDPGEQAQRVLDVGVGRQAVLTLHLWFIDGEAGGVLGKVILNSEVYRLGADSSSMVSRLSSGVAKLVADLMAANRRSSNTKSSKAATRPQPDNN